MFVVRPNLSGKFELVFYDSNDRMIRIATYLDSPLILSAKDKLLQNLKKIMVSIGSDLIDLSSLCWLGLQGHEKIDTEENRIDLEGYCSTWAAVLIVMCAVFPNKSIDTITQDIFISSEQRWSGRGPAEFVRRISFNVVLENRGNHNNPTYHWCCNDDNGEDRKWHSVHDKIDSE